MVKLITDLTEEISAAQISYWKKDEMRNALKALKKKIDDKDRERKAAVINEVVDLAKSILTENPNLPFFVHEFNGKFVLYSSLLTGAHNMFSRILGDSNFESTNFFLQNFFFT